MSSPHLPIRPLVDRRRSSSRTRLSSRSSPSPSPVGSPNTGYLKSAMKHNHVHIDPADEDCGPDAIGDGVGGHGDGDSVKTTVTMLPESGLAKAKEGSGGLSSTYSRRVGFDTFDSGMELESTGRNLGGGTGVHYSFTVSAKSARFCRSKSSRTFLVGTDLNEYSVHAMNWALLSLTEDNDEIVVLRVIEPGSSAYNAWKASMEEAKDEAETVLEKIMKTNVGEGGGEGTQINVTVEFAIGEIEETIHRMIEIYNPDSLIVGTRGRTDSVWKSAFMGSISKYCVARSPVPVVVVRPEDKVRESLSRRTQDPKRRSYLSLVSNDSLDRPRPGSSDGFRGGENGQELGLERMKSAGPIGGSGAAETKESKKDKKGKEFKKFGTFS